MTLSWCTSAHSVMVHKCAKDAHLPPAGVHLITEGLHAYAHAHTPAPLPGQSWSAPPALPACSLPGWLGGPSLSQRPPAETPPSGAWRWPPARKHMRRRVGTGRAGGAEGAEDTSVALPVNIMHSEVPRADRQAPSCTRRALRGQAVRSNPASCHSRAKVPRSRPQGLQQVKATGAAAGQGHRGCSRSRPQGQQLAQAIHAPPPEQPGARTRGRTCKQPLSIASRVTHTHTIGRCRTACTCSHRRSSLSYEWKSWRVCLYMLASPPTPPAGIHATSAPCLAQVSLLHR